MLAMTRYVPGGVSSLSNEIESLVASSSADWLMTILALSSHAPPPWSSNSAGLFRAASTCGIVIGDFGDPS